MFLILLSCIIGAFAGAATGLCVGIQGALAGGIAEKALDATIVGIDMAVLWVPWICMVTGLVVGTLGALSGTWARGFVIGLVVSGLFWGQWLVDAWSYPTGVKVWAVGVSVIAGGAAGAVGGVLRGPVDGVLGQLLGKKPPCLGDPIEPINQPPVVASGKPAKHR